MSTNSNTAVNSTSWELAMFALLFLHGVQHEQAMLLAIVEKERLFEISRKFDAVHKDIINSPILERIADENDLKHLMANSKASPAPHHRTTGGVLSPLNPANLSNLMS